LWHAEGAEESLQHETMEAMMTDTLEREVISEALILIDRGLGDMSQRDLVSTDEVSNLLLDLRMALSAPELSAPSLDNPPAPEA